MPRIIFLISLFVTTLFASVNEILPTYHIDYQYLQMLQNRGLCLDLTQLEKPYTRGQIAQSLLNIQDTGHLTALEKKVIAYLKKDLWREIQALRNKKYGNAINLKTYSTAYLDKTQLSHPAYRGVYHIGGGLNVGSHVYIANNYVSNQYDYYDPNYSGYKWRGIAAYTEQAYINIAYEHLQIKFGRDFLRWGVGQSGTLVLSDRTIPLDQFNFKMDIGPLRFSFVTAQLNSIEVNDSTGNFRANRFIAGHRLALHLLNGRFQFAVSELILYGGENTYFNMTYLNPFIFYHGAKKNGAPDNNVLPSIDALFYPFPHWRLYGSILIDDIQLDKKTPGDLEPNEIGWLIGSQYADPFHIEGLTLSAEYVRIANRTYKTPFPWERFSYRRKPLGYPLGTDLEYFQLGTEKWFGPKWIVKTKFSVLNKGEGSIFSAWDEPWMNYTVEQGYHEKFPFGIVEKTKTVAISFFYNPFQWLSSSMELRYLSINNFDHHEGQNKTDVLWRFGLTVRFNYLKDFNQPQ